MASDKLITNQWERDYSKMHPIHKEYYEALD